MEGVCREGVEEEGDGLGEGERGRGFGRRIRFGIVTCIRTVEAKCDRTAEIVERIGGKVRERKESDGSSMA